MGCGELWMRVCGSVSADSAEGFALLFEFLSLLFVALRGDEGEGRGRDGGGAGQGERGGARGAEGGDAEQGCL